jgi:hypothetical protein
MFLMQSLFPLFIKLPPLKAFFTGLGRDAFRSPVKLVLKYIAKLFVNNAMARVYRFMFKLKCFISENTRRLFRDSVREYPTVNKSDFIV